MINILLSIPWLSGQWICSGDSCQAWRVICIHLHDRQLVRGKVLHQNTNTNRTQLVRGRDNCARKALQLFPHPALI